MMKFDCIIIGAGLSGLASAITLQRQGLDTLLVEADQQVGGRVKTKKSDDGFLLDVGFQVLLSSYPELENFVDLKSLNLKRFNSGALIFEGTKLQLLANPLVHPRNMFSTLFSNLANWKDKILILKLIAEVQSQKTDESMGNLSTDHFLQSYGFSNDFIELFWRPFMSGVYLDSGLENGQQFFKFLVRCFCLGQVSVPENGMSELPIQMARQLRADSILLGQRVKSWTSTSVTLDSGKVFLAKKVICTIDPENLKFSHGNRNYRSVSTHYFTSDLLGQMEWDKWLVLIPQKLNWGLSHFCMMSSISKAYGNGKPLLSSSQIGSSQAPISKIVAEINQIAQCDLKLQLVQSFFVAKALPKIAHQLSGFEVIDEVVYASDRLSSPSINGAIRSGRLAGEKIISELKS